MGRKKKQRISYRLDAETASRLIKLGGVLSAIIITAFVWLIYQPGRATHVHLTTPDTKFRFVMQPAVAQDYISSLAPGVTRFISVVPKFTSMQARAFRVDWIHALPYEITFLADQRVNDRLGITLYVNTIPDKGSFTEEVNAWGALSHLRPIAWEMPRLTSVGKQQFTAKGNIELPADAVTALQAWPRTHGDLEKFRGAHLFELAADNSAGILLALQRALARTPFMEWATPESSAALAALWPRVDRVELAGDVTRADELTFNLELVGGATLERASAEAALNSAAGDLADTLSKDGMDLTVNGGWSDANTFKGVYRVTGFETLIHRIWRE